MPHSGHVLAPMLRKLMRWSALDQDDQQAVLRLPFRQRTIGRGTYIVREGEKSSSTSLLISGFACRHKIVGDGGRQILSVHMAGDIVDLENTLLRTADHSLQALTESEIAEVPHESIKLLARERPSVGEAMWYDTLVDASVHREWIVNVGRREARIALCHLLCEFGVRLHQAGLGELTCYELPMTQEELGDALGLTPVHVNRTLKALGREGFTQRKRQSVFIADWARLAEEGDFNPRYLHFQDEQAEPAFPSGTCKLSVSAHP